MANGIVSQDGAVLIPASVDPFQAKFVSVTRSFSYKVNCGMRGGQQYESADFFMSQTTACDPSEVEETQRKVYEYCKAEVLKSAREFIASMRSGEHEETIQPRRKP